MNRYLQNILMFAAVSLTLTSCNLFIDDDELEMNRFRDVPVHSGDGYETPITEEDNGCTIS